MATALAERITTAFLDGEDSLEINNIIHSTEGAKMFGFDAALVGGTTVYAWAIPALVEAIGEDWLDFGWIDVRFRRPVFPGDILTTRVEADADGSFTWAMTKPDGDAALAGSAGPGLAPWLDEISVPGRLEPAPAAETPALLTPEMLPVGEDIPPELVPTAIADAEEYADQLARDPHSRWHGEGARMHPGWIAGRATRLLHHTYTYRAAIHAGSQIQHFKPVRAGGPVTAAGRIAEGFQRKDHEYLLLDMGLYDDAGDELVRIRHRTIYQVAKR